MKKTTTFKKSRKKGPLRLIRSILIFLILITTVIIILELTIPVEFNEYQYGYVPARTNIDSNSLQIASAENNLSQLDTSSLRSGLFKPVTTLDRPMADANIQNIFSKLDLQFITDLDGQPVAYVKVEGQGLKRCFVGDKIEDMFTVISINENSVVIKILDHQMTLYI